MERNFELLMCRDQRGQVLLSRAPRGLAQPGMMVRLVGGVFLLVEAVLEWTGREGVTVFPAAELLQSVWGGGCD